MKKEDVDAIGALVAEALKHVGAAGKTEIGELDGGTCIVSLPKDKVGLVFPYANHAEKTREMTATIGDLESWIDLVKKEEALCRTRSATFFSQVEYCEISATTIVDWEDALDVDVEPRPLLMRSRANLFLGKSDDMAALDDIATPTSQDAFGEWLLDHGHLIVEPPGADVMELSESLQLASTSDVSGKVALRSGSVTFSYATENKATASVEVPRDMHLRVRPFRGLDVAIHVDCQFRYRQKDGKVLMWLRPTQLQRKLDDVLQQVIADARNAGLRCYTGSVNYTDAMQTRRHVADVLSGLRRPSP